MSFIPSLTLADTTDGRRGQVRELVRTFNKSGLTGLTHFWCEVTVPAWQYDSPEPESPEPESPEMIVTPTQTWTVKVVDSDGSNEAFGPLMGWRVGDVVSLYLAMPEESPESPESPESEDAPIIATGWYHTQILGFGEDGSSFTVRPPVAVPESAGELSFEAVPMIVRVPFHAFNAFGFGPPAAESEESPESPESEASENAGSIWLGKHGTATPPAFLVGGPSENFTPTEVVPGGRQQIAVDQTNCLSEWFADVSVAGDSLRLEVYP